MTSTSETAYLAGGCFWGMEELVRAIPGVLEIEVGYTGGDVQNATYERHNGHAEALKVVFDPNQLTYRHLLFEFFRMHNPTTKNRQGNDIGTSYRSAIFYLNEAQQHTAEEVIKSVNASGEWQANVHGKDATPDDKTRHARFPHLNPLPVGEGANESLREFHNTVVTEVAPFREFWRAEEYHQKYLVKNRGGYTCHYVRRLDLGEGK